jgi:hypothetical protein
MVEEGQWSDALCGYELTVKEAGVVPLQRWLERGGLYAEAQV